MCLASEFPIQYDSPFRFFQEWHSTNWQLESLTNGTMFVVSILGIWIGWRRNSESWFPVSQ
jgi:hypothetical protein